MDNKIDNLEPIIYPEDNGVRGDFKNLVMVFENAIPDKLCDNLIKFFESHKDMQTPGVVGNQNEKPWIKKTKDIPLAVHAKHLQKEIPGLIVGASKAFREYYIKNLGFQAPWFADISEEELETRFFHYINNYSVFDLIMKRYSSKEEGFYQWHNDLGVHSWNVWARRHAMLFYLNDVDEGGETEFLHSGEKIKPKKGSIAFFPPYHTHQHKAHQPISNDKYIISSWFCADLSTQEPELVEKLQSMWDEEVKKMPKEIRKEHKLFKEARREISQKITFEGIGKKLEE